MEKILKIIPCLAAFLLPIVAIFFPKILGGIIGLILFAYLVVMVAKDYRVLPALFKKLLVPQTKWLFPLFLALGFESLLWSPSPAQAVVQVLSCFVGFAVLYGFCYWQEEGIQKPVFYALFAGYLLALDLLVIQNIGTFSMSTWFGRDKGIHWGVLLNRAVIVLTLTVWPVLCGLGFLSQPKKRLGVIELAILAVTAVFVFSSFSETSKLAYAVGLLFYGLSYVLSPLLLARLVAVGAGVLVLCLPFICPVIFAHLPPAAFDWDQASSGARLEIWRIVSDKILQQPFFGYGFEASRYIDFGYHSENIFMAKDFKILHPHNSIFQLWLEFGFLGAGFAIALLVAWLRLFVTKPLYLQRALLGLMTSVICIYLTGYGMWQSWQFTAVILAGYYSCSFARARAGTPANTVS